MSTIDRDWVFFTIFTYLPPKQLAKCRQLSSKWKTIIDKCLPQLWRSHCQRDYPDICDTAAQKSNGCYWYDLYRSLSLWSILPQARETVHQIHANLHGWEKIESFQVLNSGFIGIKLRKKIIYYSINLPGSVWQRLFVNSNDVYQENIYVMSTLRDNAQLNIITKMNTNVQFETIYTIFEVKHYLIINANVYFITSNNYLYIYTQSGGVFNGSILTYMPDTVLSLGSRDGNLYVLTHSLTIQMWDGYELKNVQVSEMILQDLRKYNFLEQLDWRTFYYWWTFRRKIPRTLLLLEIVTVHIYGQMLFVGFHWGVLHVYNCSNSDDLQEIMKRKPLKIYNFMERELLSLSPVFQIDVAESADGHILLVSMPEKFIIINFSHALHE